MNLKFKRNKFTFNNLIYFHPWTRIHSYQIGVISGIWYYEWKQQNKNTIFVNSIGTIIHNKVRDSRILRYSLFVIGFIMINFIIFISHFETQKAADGERAFSQIQADFYTALARPMFLTMLMLILIGPLVGKNRALRWLLGSRGWEPWAKLSFMTYLIHILVFQWYYGQTKQSTYFSHKPVIWTFLAISFLTFLLSIGFSALFEAPFLQLERMVLFPPKKERNR
jgi:peptidoglycan/LPS O-acetylase OafA/YrhL